MGLDILDGNPSAGGFGNPQSLRIRIPNFFFENIDSRIPQLKDSGNLDFYGIGRSTPSEECEGVENKESDTDCQRQKDYGFCYFDDELRRTRMEENCAKTCNICK